MARTVKAALMHRDPTDPEVQKQIGRHFQLIDDYVQDSRFTAFYEKVKPGGAEFLRRAMAVCADKLEGKG